MGQGQRLVGSCQRQIASSRYFKLEQFAVQFGHSYVTEQRKIRNDQNALQNIQPIARK